MRADARENYEHLLAAAHEAIAEHGAEASLRDIARRAGVGLGTLYRHFPTREALLEVLLRTRLDQLTQNAGELETGSPPGAALVSWFLQAVAFVRTYNGVVALMAAAIEDPESALHASCETVRSAGTRLLVRAQAEGTARADIDGTDLFALIGALGWVGDQPTFSPRAGRLADLVLGAILTPGEG
ncbi:TetR/AcrR family transcriptional regulator [Pseudoxanthomonas sp. SGNA-20]|uniref:TetR/AcrR family transcriptional regulator n=1 Tax=Pseudoxanthomonas sp. SGNA-20 TaxID=2493088 RepID=UPI000F637BE4|nr:TetR/AcrR family transcriptional regulator [Pseudoxanthomonas sp. SGNA-20]RRN54511.1 TetR/AcrR family transcriptional regulator [Pseudoxanthomonas sp. SGNA-20]